MANPVVVVGPTPNGPTVITGGTAPQIIKVPAPPVVKPIQILAGTQGPKGDPGTPLKVSYKHSQDVAALVWTIKHGLAFVPNVAIADSAGSLVHGAIAYVDPQTITVTFSVPFSGTAYCS